MMKSIFFIPILMTMVAVMISDVNCFTMEIFESSYRLHTTTLKMSSDSAKTRTQKPAIAIIGSGAVGCYYGARLWETDAYEVKFHMRGEHYKVSSEMGLNVTSVEGDIFIPPDELMAFDKTEEMGTFDWVIVALKSTGIDAVPDLLPPLLRDNTRILCIMNGLVDDDIVRLLEGQEEDEEPVLTKCAAVYGGMALLCSNRKAPGHVDHSYAGKLTASITRTSDSFPDLGLHREAMLDLWQPTRGFEFCYDDNIVRARWSKNLWNLPFNGISVAMGGITVDKIVSDPGLRRLSFMIMDETLAVCNKDMEIRGFSSDDFLGEIEKRQMMDLSDGMGPYKTSTMLDLVNRNPMEVKYLFSKAVKRANQLKVPVPTLSAIVTQIEAFQRFHNLY